MKPLVFLVLSFALSSAKADVHLIPFEFGAEHKAEIPTVYWEKPGSKAVLVFLPGGSGSFDYTKNPRFKNPTWIFSDLYNSNLGLVDPAYLDSYHPLELYAGTAWERLGPRRTAKHLEQIKVTISYFAQKTKKPVFVIGHSNGAISLAEFLNQNPENQKMLAGVIFSGSRNETEVKQNLSIPVLVLHHRTDSNRWTSPESAKDLFSSIKNRNSAATIQMWVEGGADVPGGNPTHTGKHMYFDATAEAAQLIEKFIATSLESK